MTKKEEIMIYTHEQGNPSDPAVVFLHGGGLSHTSWLPVIEHLPDFHCLAPDLPGHGKSQDVPFTLEGSARAVAVIIRQKTPHGKAHIVSLSLGGAVALTLMRLEPVVADHLILSGCSGRLAKWLVQMSLPMFGILKWMKPETIVRSTMKQHLIPDEYYDLLHDDILASNQIEFLKPIYTELTGFTAPEKVTSPLLVCVGEKEPGAAKLYGEIALQPLKKYPAAHGVAMPGGGHAWALQFPEVFAQMVRAWVTDSPLPDVLKVVKR